MTLVNKISIVQNFFPDELKHALLVLRRAKHWKESEIIFVHIPKAAGASINYTLYGRFMGHATANQIKTYAPKIFTKYPSFAITRDPWSRCVSAYRFVKAGAGKSQQLTAGVHNKNEYTIPEFRSFESFVQEWLIDQDINNIADLDYVFRPQLPYVSDLAGNIIVSFLGRLEDMQSVQEFLSDTLNRKIEIGHENQSGEKVSHREWYNPELIDIVSEVYANDIEAFGYSYE